MGKNTLLLEELSAIESSLELGSEFQKYWFVRTMGGDLYGDFLESNSISIAYDEVSYKSIEFAFRKKDPEYLSEEIQSAYPEETRPNYIANQLIDFCFNIKKGDIVIIPSDSTNYISIGKVRSTPIEILTGTATHKKFLKRKPIKWIQQNVNFNKLDSRLLKLKYTQRTISQVPEDLIKYIDRCISPIYMKDGYTHIALNVEKKNNVGASTFLSTWIELLDLTSLFCQENEIDFDKEEPQINVNVQSPGVLELISKSIEAILIFGLITAAIIGGEFETKSKLLGYHKIKCPGLLKKIEEFRKNKFERIKQNRLLDKLDDMNVNPDKILDILSSKNDSSDEKN